MNGRMLLALESWHKLKGSGPFSWESDGGWRKAEDSGLFPLLRSMLSEFLSVVPLIFIVSLLENVMEEN